MTGASRAAPPLRILYVEDNDNLRETIGMLLESDAREVTTVASAELALAAWQADRFDVLVTDVSLPGLSGTALARRVLADAPQQWIVLCSGYGLAMRSPRSARTCARCPSRSSSTSSRR